MTPVQGRQQGRKAGASTRSGAHGSGGSGGTPLAYNRLADGDSTIAAAREAPLRSNRAYRRLICWSSCMRSPISLAARFMA